VDRVAERYPISFRNQNTFQLILSVETLKREVSRRKPRFASVARGCRTVLLIGCANVANLGLTRATGPAARWRSAPPIGATRGLLIGSCWPKVSFLR